MNAIKKIKQLSEDCKYGTTIFYLSATEDSSIAAFDKMKALANNDIWWEMQAGAVASVTFSDGTEITFLPVSEASELTSLPKSDYVFVETNENSKALAHSLAKHTNVFVAVDAESQELL